MNETAHCLAFRFPDRRRCIAPSTATSRASHRHQERSGRRLRAGPESPGMGAPASSSVLTMSFHEDRPPHTSRELPLGSWLPAPKHYAILTTVFPKFSPVKMPLKAVGTCSTPSTMCILNFMLPSMSHPPSCSCIFPRRCSQVEFLYD